MSHLIRFATGEKVSHVAIEFSDGVYAHSNLLGVRFDAKEQFEQDSEVIAFCQFPTDTTTEKLLRNTVHAYQGSGYDILGALYLLPILCLRTYFGIKLSGSNRWANKKLFLCTEFVSQVILGEQDSLITPARLYYKLRSKFGPEKTEN